MVCGLEFCLWKSGQHSLQLQHLLAVQSLHGLQSLRRCMLRMSCVRSLYLPYLEIYNHTHMSTSVIHDETPII